MIENKVESVNTNKRDKLLPCPICGDAWFYALYNPDDADFKTKKFRIMCKCHLAWDQIKFMKTKKAATEMWNKFVVDFNKQNETVETKLKE